MSDEFVEYMEDSFGVRMDMDGLRIGNEHSGDSENKRTVYYAKDMVAKVKEGKVALVTLKKESQETQANLEKEVAALKKLTIDTSCLEASGKHKDMKIAELQNELELKKNQIKELTKICDDLMEKVGDGH
ncbi:Hypothetical predicted protein [Octopus vulgaris]|uniref:Uncharacterized protein n=1 Tax=Octopus vulgaris TaxID=6645 RepID=A0AA36AFY7_OCTVU|nr:Hypothetical predicted protein [Octopus vulgaris]